MLRRMPPLRFLERRLRVGQVLREDVAVGDFLSEPDFDLALALRSLRGGQLFGRGALFGVLERGLGVGQPEFERVPGRGRLCERGGELRFAPGESFGAAAAPAAQSCWARSSAPSASRNCCASVSRAAALCATRRRYCA